MYIMIWRYTDKIENWIELNKANKEYDSFLSCAGEAGNELVKHTGTVYKVQHWKQIYHINISNISQSSFSHTVVSQKSLHT